MAEFLLLGERALTIEDVEAIARQSLPVRLAESARERVALGRRRLEEALGRGERIYGVNTGIGGNVKISLAPEDMETLQANLVRQLACGTGQPLPADVVRAAVLLRVATFLPGASGVRVELVDALLALLNRGVTPVVPRYGSVGASGDLMPSGYRVAPGCQLVFVGHGVGRARRRQSPTAHVRREPDKAHEVLLRGSTVEKDASDTRMRIEQRSKVVGNHAVRLHRRIQTACAAT